ncbi:hypothetical protein [Nocardia sp. NPDC004260]
MTSPTGREPNTGNSRSVSMEIRPITGSPAAADVAADLRALADLVENDGDGFIAAMLGRLLTADVGGAFVIPAHCTGFEHETQPSEVMAEAIRRLKKVAVQPVEKEYTDELFRASICMRALGLRLIEQRTRMCERVVTGVETITEEIPDPDYIAAAPKVTQTREVEIVEWKCAPVLAAGQEGDAR